MLPNEDSRPMLHVRARGRKETLFLDKTVGACYDEVLKKVDTLDFDEALQAFSEFSMGDALVRLAYFQDKLHWDAVLRFDTTLHSPHHSHQRELREAFEFELLKEGLLVEKEASLDGKPDAFIKILCPFDKLAAEAQARRLHLPVKTSRYSGIRMAISESGKTWTHFLDRWWRIDHAPHLSQIWAKFKRKKLNHFVKGPSETTRVEAMKHLFNNSQRNLLVHGILQRIIVRDRKGRCKDLDKLIDEGTYLNVYPIHDGSSHLTSSLNLRSKLGAMWNGTQQPIHDIQSYYGEKVAFYFAWLEHYTFWLFLIGGIGSVVMMYGIFVSFSSTSLVDLQYNTESILKLSQALDNQLTLPFAFCMSVWGLLYVQWWSRRNQFLVSQWNMMDFFKEEKTRPAWRATGVKLSLVSGKLESHFSWTRRNLLRGTSIALIACLLIIMIISVESYILYNAWISHFLRKHHPDLAYLASVTSATIALLASVVLSGISRYISQKLTDLENHRTMSEYENSLIAKYLVFDFVNFYGILIYIAVAKVWVQKSGTGLLGNQEWAEQCLYRNCMLELSIQMATIFIGISLLQHLLNYLSPICQRGWSGFRRSHLAKRILKENMKNHRRRLTGAKQSNSLRRYRDLCLPQFFIDANLADAESDFILLNGYNAAVVQFGFLVLFSVAFPLAPLFGAFHNTIQRKIDANNLISQYKRPFALQAQNIGVWETFLWFMACLGVAMNACTIAFSSPYFEAQYLSYFETDVGKWAGRLGFILIFEHAVFIVFWTVKCLMPPVPRKVSEALKRHDYVEKIVRGDKEDEETPIQVPMQHVCCF